MQEVTSVGGIQIRYKLSGRENRPVVLLSHSLSTRLEMWDAQMPALEPEFGVLRYDVEEVVAEVSVYLVPGQLGKGLGAPLLLAGSAWVRHNVPAVRTIHARIRADNVASRWVFERALYVLDHDLYRLDLTQ